VKQTKQEKLKNFNDLIKERKEYLETIERNIEAVTEAGSNRLFELNGEIEAIESKRAELLKVNYQLEQTIRQNKILANTY